MRYVYQLDGQIGRIMGVMAVLCSWGSGNPPIRRMTQTIGGMLVLTNSNGDASDSVRAWNSAQQHHPPSVTNGFPIFLVDSCGVALENVAKSGWDSSTSARHDQNTACEKWKTQTVRYQTLLQPVPKLIPCAICSWKMNPFYLCIWGVRPEGGL